MGAWSGQIGTDYGLNWSVNYEQMCSCGGNEQMDAITNVLLNHQDKLYPENTSHVFCSVDMQVITMIMMIQIIIIVPIIITATKPNIIRQ